MCVQWLAAACVGHFENVGIDVQFDFVPPGRAADGGSGSSPPPWASLAVCPSRPDTAHGGYGSSPPPWAPPQSPRPARPLAARSKQPRQRPGPVTSVGGAGIFRWAKAFVPHAAGQGKSLQHLFPPFEEETHAVGTRAAVIFV